MTAESKSIPHEARMGGEALVTVASGTRVRLRLVDDPEAEREARVAVVDYAPEAGDRVLALRLNEQLFIVGVLHSRASAGNQRELSHHGATCRLTDAGFELLSPEGSLVASYQPSGSGGALRVVAPGDLELSAPEGSLRISARDELELRGKTTIAGESLNVRTESVDIEAGVWSLRAARVFERAEDAFYDVSRVLETRAHRLRTIVGTTLDLFGKRTTIRSKEDTRVDGKRVLLG